MGFFLFNRIILFVADQIKEQSNSVADFHFISKPIKAIGAVVPIYSGKCVLIGGKGLAYFYLLSFTNFTVMINL